MDTILATFLKNCCWGTSICEICFTLIDKDGEIAISVVQDLMVKNYVENLAEVITVMFNLEETTTPADLNPVGNY
ncbi:hypothetical protein DGG96_17320 [Legionella qingyii]|uniref:Uncharacterized protein n=1 Tax=Legionella qingyii TaxID=2184757 RepID=A0A317TZ58_9GAMM|nr:hypothetical protein DGG96_17320 [Legionella qingyii]